MQAENASQQSAELSENPAPMVGPLGGIVFCALCLAAYVAVVVAFAMS
jgi:hypothetical protein